MLERDAIVDRALALEVPDDGPDLPGGCVPYLPCPVDSLLAMIELARIDADDLLVDIGSGVGRALAVVHLLTGARAIGIEAQSGLVRAARELARSLGSSRIETLHGDATELVATVTEGTVYFLYCPFGGARLERVLESLEAIATEHPIRVCSVGIPELERPWLVQLASRDDLIVYASR